MKELQKEIETRLNQITLRLQALIKEKTMLEAEQEHLGQLHSIYKKAEYDPITEERRVTEHLNHKPLYTITSASPMGRKPTPSGTAVASATKLILQEHPRTISELLSEIFELLPELDWNRKKVNDYVGRNIRSGIIHKNDKGELTWNSK